MLDWLPSHPCKKRKGGAALAVVELQGWASPNGSQHCHAIISPVDSIENIRESARSGREINLDAYKDRRKFSMSCICDLVRALKLLMTPLASELQLERKRS
jgi:hypothetical protein